MQDLLDYWAAGNPPLHRMVAAYFEIEEQEPEEATRPTSLNELEALVKQLNG